MSLDLELYRLIELMPASGRMYIKLTSDPKQATVIKAPVPRPGSETRSIQINSGLWEQLSQPQRDLLLLRTVSWALAFKWFKPDLYQGLLAAGLGATVVELLWADAAGVLTATAVTIAAGSQVLRKSRSPQAELEADEKAVQIAQRRGYSRTQAKQALLEAIERVVELEGRPGLTVVELLRVQNMRAIENDSLRSIPEPLYPE